MLACDCCLKWYHCLCVGLSMEEAKNETVWRCESCVDIEILESIDHGQRTDLRKLTVDDHKLLKNMNIPEASEDTLGVANLLVELVSRLELSIKLRFLGPQRNKVPEVQRLAAKAFDLDILHVNNSAEAFDFKSLLRLMAYDKEIVPSLFYPSESEIKEQYSLFKKAVSELLEQHDYLKKNLMIDQLQVYGDLIRKELSVVGGSLFRVIFIPLCRAMTRLTVEAITESMGSLLKMQYQVNMNIETLLHETQIVIMDQNFTKLNHF